MRIPSQREARGRRSTKCHASFVALCWWLATGAAHAQSPSAPAPRGGQAGQNQLESEYQQGTKLLQEGRYNDALDRFREIERTVPHSPYGPAGEGIALSLMARPREAIDALQQALKLDPSFWI